MEREKKLSTSRTTRFECKGKEHLVKEGVAVDFETNTFLKEIINNQSDIPFKIDSPQYLLWEQQMILSSLKSGKCMVWHPLIIRWCLSIYLKSPGTYQHIRNSPFLFYIYNFNMDIHQLEVAYCLWLSRNAAPFFYYLYSHIKKSSKIFGFFTNFYFTSCVVYPLSMYFAIDFSLLSRLATALKLSALV